MALKRFETSENSLRISSIFAYAFYFEIIAAFFGKPIISNLTGSTSVIELAFWKLQWQLRKS